MPGSRPAWSHAGSPRAVVGPASRPSSAGSPHAVSPLWMPKQTPSLAKRVPDVPRPARYGPGLSHPWTTPAPTNLLNTATGGASPFTWRAREQSFRGRTGDLVARVLRPGGRRFASICLPRITVRNRVCILKRGSVRLDTSPPSLRPGGAVTGKINISGREQPAALGQANTMSNGDTVDRQCHAPLERKLPLPT